MQRHAAVICEHCGEENQLLSPLQARAYMGVGSATLNRIRLEGWVPVALAIPKGNYFRRSDLDDAKRLLRMRDEDTANREEIYHHA